MLGFPAVLGMAERHGSNAVTEGCSGQEHKIRNIQKRMFSKLRCKVIFFPCGIFAVSTYRGGERKNMQVSEQIVRF